MRALNNRLLLLTTVVDCGNTTDVIDTSLMLVSTPHDTHYGGDDAVYACSVGYSSAIAGQDRFNYTCHVNGSWVADDPGDVCRCESESLSFIYVFFLFAAFQYSTRFLQFE